MADLNDAASFVPEQSRYSLAKDSSRYFNEQCNETCLLALPCPCGLNRAACLRPRWAAQNLALALS